MDRLSIKLATQNSINMGGIENCRRHASIIFVDHTTTCYAILRYNFSCNSKRMALRQFPPIDLAV